MSVLASVSMTCMRLGRSSGDKSFRQALREPKPLSEIKQERVVPIHTEDGSNWQKERAWTLRRGPLAPASRIYCPNDVLGHLHRPWMMVYPIGVDHALVSGTTPFFKVFIVDRAAIQG
jgi:hypothetical protein